MTDSSKRSGSLALTGSEALRRYSMSSALPTEEINDPVSTPPSPLPENVFGVGIACFIRDLHWLMSQGLGESRWLKMARVTLAMGITIFAMALQVFLIYETKMLVTPRVVQSIRRTYGHYETVMYTDYATGTKHTTVTINGFERGIPEFFNASNFQHLPDDLKDAVCRIPLSQPSFFFIVCMIWTMTCMSDMRENVSIWIRLMFKVPTVDSMSDALATKEDGEDGELVVDGLTSPVKVLLTFVICLPRLLITGFLLWLGCRWLVATESFSDLILNAVALEFILLLRELIYNTVVPHATQVHTATTYIPHLLDYEIASLQSYFGMFALLAVACVYTYFYMYHFQSVLPEYKWDVRGPCVDFLAAEMSGLPKAEM